MIRGVLASTAVAALFFAISQPAFGQSGFRGFAKQYQWSTTRPFSGFAWIGGRQRYCDYIKYPKRHCYPQRVCKGGGCYYKQKCKFVGWDIRQTCR